MQKQTKRQRTAPLLLTDEQEEDLTYWLKLNDILYMKGKWECKDIALKKSLWEKKVAEFGVHVKSLNTYDSVRTRVGELMSQPSGSSSRGLMDRDDFLLRNFGFLTTQIARRPSRLAIRVSFCLNLIFFSFILHRLQKKPPKNYQLILITRFCYPDT